MTFLYLNQTIIFQWFSGSKLSVENKVEVKASGCSKRKKFMFTDCQRAENNTFRKLRKFIQFRIKRKVIDFLKQFLRTFGLVPVKLVSSGGRWVSSVVVCMYDRKHRFTRSRGPFYRLFIGLLFFF